MVPSPQGGKCIVLSEKDYERITGRRPSFKDY